MAQWNRCRCAQRRRSNREDSRKWTCGLLTNATTSARRFLSTCAKCGKPYLGLTATPLTSGLGNNYDEIVNASTTEYLLHTDNPATGAPYLAPLLMRPCKEIRMEGAKSNAGEWQAGEVTKRTRPIIGDIVSTWVEETQKWFGRPVKTLMFTSEIAHGVELCAAFQARGIDARNSTYRDSADTSD